MRRWYGFILIVFGEILFLLNIFGVNGFLDLWHELSFCRSFFNELLAELLKHSNGEPVRWSLIQNAREI